MLILFLAARLSPWQPTLLTLPGDRQTLRIIQQYYLDIGTMSTNHFCKYLVSFFSQIEHHSGLEWHVK